MGNLAFYLANIFATKRMREIMRITDRRRFYIDKRGGNVWDHLDPVEKARAILWEEAWTETFTKLLKGFKGAINNERLKKK